MEGEVDGGGALGRGGGQVDADDEGAGVAAGVVGDLGEVGLQLVDDGGVGGRGGGMEGDGRGGGLAGVQGRQLGLKGGALA